MGKKGIAAWAGIFLLGMIAGSGTGLLYGRGIANEQREQRIALLESQVATATENYTLMVREYNKLYALKAGSLTSVASLTQTAAQPAVAAEVAPAPASSAAETAVPAAATAEGAPTEPTAEATAAPTEVPAATIVAEFEAESLNGTGPLEGAPPQPFQFTDLSSGEITSWKWEFGDGETSDEQNPKHTIEKCPMDLCTVSLTVCGPAGCDTETKVEYLWVSEQCTGC
jgi:hypothetical protein